MHARLVLGVRNVVIVLGKSLCAWPDVQAEVSKLSLHDAVPRHWAFNELIEMTPYGVIGRERVNTGNPRYNSQLQQWPRITT